MKWLDKILGRNPSIVVEKSKSYIDINFEAYKEIAARLSELQNIYTEELYTVIAGKDMHVSFGTTLPSSYAYRALSDLTFTVFIYIRYKDGTSEARVLEQCKNVYEEISTILSEDYHCKFRLSESIHRTFTEDSIIAKANEINNRQPVPIQLSLNTCNVKTLRLYDNSLEHLAICELKQLNLEETNDV